jgi:hypothetical protein
MTNSGVRGVSGQLFSVLACAVLLSSCTSSSHWHRNEALEDQLDVAARSASRGTLEDAANLRLSHFSVEVYRAADELVPGRGPRPNNGECVWRSGTANGVREVLVALRQGDVRTYVGYDTGTPHWLICFFDSTTYSFARFKVLLPDTSGGGGAKVVPGSSSHISPAPEFERWASSRGLR